MSDENASPPATLTEERLARLIRLSARGFKRSLEIRLQTYGVTFGQWTFLRILWAEDGLSQRELAVRAHLTEPTTHTAIARLQAQGLVTRRNLGGNKRRQHVLLTQKGQDLRQHLEPLAVEANAIAVAGLSKSEQATLRHALLTIIRNLRIDEEEAVARGEKVPPTRTTGEV